MPELPEVETVARTLAPAVEQRNIVRVSHARADLVRPVGCDFAHAVQDRRIIRVDRRAKRLVFTLDDGEQFYLHLGMTGRVSVDDPSVPPRPHTHLTIDLSDGRELRFSDPRRFGRIVWLGTCGHERVGPEPLTIRPAQLHRRLNLTRRPIKAALLDQTVIGGLGNIYVDEALHTAAIHPATPANLLTPDKVRRLNRAIKHVIRAAITAGGSSIRDYVNSDGRAGGFQKQHRVYGQTGRACRRCRTIIIRIIVAGRSTHLCPACQHLPRQ